jgi:tetratricopeptide (TPR) repeat protein
MSVSSEQLQNLSAVGGRGCSTASSVSNQHFRTQAHHEHPWLFSSSGSGVRGSPLGQPTGRGELGSQRHSCGSTTTTRRRTSSFFDRVPAVVFSQLLTEFVYAYLDAADVCRLSIVCSAAYHAQLHPKVWRGLVRTTFRLSEAQCTALESICSHALSSGVTAESAASVVVGGEQTNTPQHAAKRLSTRLDKKKKSVVSGGHRSAGCPVRGSLMTVVTSEPHHLHGAEENARCSSFQRFGLHSLNTKHDNDDDDVDGDDVWRKVVHPVAPGSYDLESESRRGAHTPVPDHALTQPASDLRLPVCDLLSYLSSNQTASPDANQQHYSDTSSFSAIAIDDETLEAVDVMLSCTADQRLVSTPATRPSTAIVNRHVEVTPGSVQQHGSCGVPIWHPSSHLGHFSPQADWVTPWVSLEQGGAHHRTTSKKLHSTPAAAASSSPKRVVCAATAALTLTPVRTESVAHCASVYFPWRAYFVSLYRRRIVHVIQHHRRQRVHAVHAAAAGDFVRSERYMSETIAQTIQAGCDGLNELARQLVRDLAMRGHIFHRLGRDDEAFGDYALASLLDSACGEAFSAACELALSFAGPSDGSPFIMRRGGSFFLSPEFNFEREYDRVVSGGTVFERAAFIFESLYYRGPECATYVVAYLLCDAVKYWPSRLLRLAEANATAEFQRLICYAWRAFDSGQRAKSCEYAELAVELLPTGFKHRVEHLLARTNAEHGGDAGSTSSNVSIAHAVLAAEKSMAGGFPDGQEEGNAVPTQQQQSHALSSFAYFTLAFVSNQLDVAIEAYRKCLLTNPRPSRRAVALNNLASLLMSRNDLASARLLLEESIATNNKYFMTYRNLAKCLARMGDRDAAHGVLTTAIQICRPLPADAFAERSKYSSVSVQDDLDEATRLNPRLSYPYRLRAALLMDRQRDLDALKELDRALEISFDPQDAALRAVFKRDLGDLEGAISDMAVAAALCPTSTEYSGWLRDALADVMNESAIAGALPGLVGGVNDAPFLDTVHLPPSLAAGSAPPADDDADGNDDEAGESDREEVPNASLTELLQLMRSESDISEMSQESYTDRDATPISSVSDQVSPSISPTSSNRNTASSFHDGFLHDQRTTLMLRFSEAVLSAIFSQYYLCMTRSSAAEYDDYFAPRTGIRPFFAPWRNHPTSFLLRGGSRQRGGVRGFVLDGLYVTPHRSAVGLKRGEVVVALGGIEQEGAS